MLKKIVGFALVLLIIQGCGPSNYNGKLYKKYKVSKEVEGISVSKRKNSNYFRGNVNFSMFEDQLLIVVKEDKNLKFEDIVENNIAYNKQQEEEAAKKKKELTTESAIITEEVTSEGAVITEGAITKKEESDDNVEERNTFKKKKKVILKERYRVFAGVKYRGRNWIYIGGMKLKNVNSGEEIEIPFGRAVSDEITLENGVTVTGGVYETAFFTLKREESANLYNIVKAEDVEITLLSMYDKRVFTRKLQKKEKEEIIRCYEYFQKLDIEEQERIKNGIEDKKKKEEESNKNIEEKKEENINEEEKKKEEVKK